MKSSIKKNSTFYCFSPPIMMATFVIETSLALYAIYRYHLNEVAKLVVAALFMLGLFQLAEYFVCGGAGLSANQWSRVGYVAITTLPALGLHMMYAINGSHANKLVMLAYGSMAAFITYFLISPTAFAGYQCTGNYVIFQLGNTPTIFYMLFYYGWLMIAMSVGLSYLIKKAPNRPKNAHNLTKALMLGYAVFLVPTITVYAINPATSAGIPSIMCGFAILFALIMAMYILPRATEAKPSGDQATQKHS